MRKKSNLILRDGILKQIINGYKHKNGCALSIFF